MKIKSFAVLDTNVIVSGLLSEKSYPSEILKLVKTGNIIPVFDKRMLDEYLAILNLRKFNFSQYGIEDTLRTIIGGGIFVNDVERTKSHLIDKGDIPFFEVAESTSDDFETHLVTGNLKHFPSSSTIVSPKMFIEMLKYLDRFLENAFDYDKNVQDIIDTNLEKPKYQSGDKLIQEMVQSIDNIPANIIATPPKSR